MFSDKFRHIKIASETRICYQKGYNIVEKARMRTISRTIDASVEER